MSSKFEDCSLPTDWENVSNISSRSSFWMSLAKFCTKSSFSDSSIRLLPSFLHHHRRPSPSFRPAFWPASQLFLYSHTQRFFLELFPQLEFFLVAQLLFAALWLLGLFFDRFLSSFSSIFIYSLISFMMSLVQMTFSVKLFFPQRSSFFHSEFVQKFVNAFKSPVHPFTCLFCWLFDDPVVA